MMYDVTKPPIVSVLPLLTYTVEAALGPILAEIVIGDVVPDKNALDIPSELPVLLLGIRPLVTAIDVVLLNNAIDTVAVPTEHSTNTLQIITIVELAYVGVMVVLQTWNPSVLVG